MEGGPEFAVGSGKRWRRGQPAFRGRRHDCITRPDPPHRGSLDAVLQAVNRSQGFIEIGVITVDETDDALVLSEDALKETDGRRHRSNTWRFNPPTLNQCAPKPSNKARERRPSSKRNVGSEQMTVTNGRILERRLDR